MDKHLPDRRWPVLWQLLLLLCGTTWLLAPYLNHELSYRVSLISQYESPSQPFSWLFRIGDVLAAVLLLWLANKARRMPVSRPAVVMLFIIGVGMLIDPLFATSCRVQMAVCREYVSPVFAVHGTETIITALTVFALGVYDFWRRRRLTSLGFVVFQLAYGILFISQLADQDNFNTLSQYLYQLLVLVWLAWFGRELLVGEPWRFLGRTNKYIRLTVAAWAFLNGLLAILISLRHISLTGRLKGLYFVGNEAWLAQHGVIIGVIMLYLSRHLARGELRARQIFLLITGLEAIKYAVITPSLSLMLVYAVTFCGLFVLRDVFDRGAVPVAISERLKDAMFMIGSLLLAALLALLVLSRTPQLSRITARSVDYFFDYAVRSKLLSHSQIKSVLLAHTISAFLLAGIGAILWILFRPYKYSSPRRRDYLKIEELMGKYSDSSEDYFKLWPRDKDYFWDKDHSGFVAYKVVGTTVFALADPICMPALKAELLQDFIAWTRSRRWRVCFLPIYEPSLKLYKTAGLNSLQVGSSALVGITDFLENITRDKWWRWQKNRAIKSGYQYGIAGPPHSPEFIKRLKKVSDGWLQSGRQERGFALGYFDRRYMERCAIHYLTGSDGHIVAFTNQLPQFKVGDVASVDLLRHLPEADNAMPYLLMKTMETLAPDYKNFDLGFVPFAVANNPVLSVARVLSGGRFSARGLEQFKNKFKPKWEANYLAYDGDLSDLAVIAVNLENAMKLEP